MTPHTSPHHRSNPFLVASTLLVAVGCILLTACGTTSSAQKNAEVDAAPRQVTLSGSSVCLPHRDTSGPQTMECAFGLKTDDGSYYALDLLILESEILRDFPTQERLTLKGTLIPLEDIDERTWNVYDIVGQLRVTSAHHEA